MSEAEGASRSVAVIGAGPAGVVACRYLREAGHRPTAFEAAGEVGGIWAPEPANSVVYRGLTTNIPTVAMQSFDLDFPNGLPSYVRGSDLGDYIAAYADHFGLRPLIRFGTEVTSVMPGPGDASWTVRSRGSAGEAQERFDAVVVAKGHYDEPYAPEIPGQAAWLAADSSRTVVHSREYDDPQVYAGRVVLVVGGRSSAVDIARELRGVASAVYVLEKGCEKVLAEASCMHVPLGSELQADGRLRVGGEAIAGPPVDGVILATGYVYAFPFLDAGRLGLEFGPARRFVEPLWMHAVHARHPTLCFIGVPLAVPCPVPLFEAQSRFVAAHLRQELAPLEEREAWVASRREAVGARTQDWHFLGPHAWEYMRQLTALSGVAGAEYEAYDRRLSIVSQVYQDRVAKRPALPWGDDWFRRCQYTVDWERGTWEVLDPPEACARL